MNIIARKREFLQCVLPCIPKKLVPLFSFGYDTLVGREVLSMRGNARLSSRSWWSAKSNAWRLTTNDRIATIFPKLLSALSLVCETDIIAIDFSDFGNGRQVLMFAKQTKKGRAIPLYFEILEYPIEKDSQNLFVIETIKHFFEAAGCTPTLVFDRGFACPSIIKFLAQNKHAFIIRIKKRKSLADQKTEKTCAAEDFKTNDVLVHAYDNDLRLVVSDKPANDNDPWYLITNDATATRDGIITMYYHRFEIEEFFRDCKRIIGFEYLRFKTTRGLSIALWFAILTCWLFERMTSVLTDAQECERSLWAVSQFRYVYERIRIEGVRALAAVENPPLLVAV
jgi:hypothetical protein